MKEALTGRPETIQIVFPMWREEDKHYTHLDAIVGSVAHWAVKQSPYDVPENMSAALQELTDRLLKRYKWECLPMMACRMMNCDEICEMLVKEFEFCPAIMAWNEKKIEGATHRHPINPDYDFIGLDALARNVSHSLTLEAPYEKGAAPTPPTSSPSTLAEPSQRGGDSVE